MKILSVPIVALALICFASPVLAEVEHVISVEVDAAMAGDLEMVESALDGLADDTEAPRSMRRLMNNIASDLIDLSANRLDDEGYLTKDDGSLVYVMAEDSVMIKPRHLNRAYPNMKMCRFFDNSAKRTKRSHRRACVFVLRKVDGTYVKQPIPAGKGCRGPNAGSLHDRCKEHGIAPAP